MSVIEYIEQYIIECIAVHLAAVSVLTTYKATLEG